MRRFMSAQRFTLLPLLATGLAACGGPPSPPVANVQPVVASAVAAAPTATLAPTATTTPTTVPTTVPTATIVPTDAPTPEPTPTPDVSLVADAYSFARGTVVNRPWMVMIDNHPNAYPQSGLGEASMVFEGLAEYGITRFVALYNDGVSPELNEIGPVRSTRVYFAQWAMGFQPIYAHAGGSPDGVALAESTDQFVNFEALRENNYTWRDNRRLAPHNLYTKSDLLRSFANNKGVRALDDPKAGYLFDNLAPAATVDASTIDYYFKDTSSRAGFRYDPATNAYSRVMRGQPHIDRVTGNQLSTRNVVVMEVAGADRIGDDKQRIDQEVIGSGAARIFTAGRNVSATWRKESAEAPLRFYTEDGAEFVFNAGQIWVAAIPSLDRLTIQ